MLQQATDYRIYDQEVFLSGIESAEEKKEKKNPSPPKQKGKKERLWSQANISLGLLLSKSRKVTWIIWCPKVSVYEKFCSFLNIFLLFMTRVDELAHHLLFMINKNAPTGAPVSLAWRLDGQMRRRLIVHETGFTRWRFLLLTLSTSIVLQDNNFLFVSELI